MIMKNKEDFITCVDVYSKDMEYLWTLRLPYGGTPSSSIKKAREKSDVQFGVGTATYFYKYYKNIKNNKNIMGMWYKRDCHSTQPPHNPENKYMDNVIESVVRETIKKIIK
jgi:hypothetical protein